MHSTVIIPIFYRLYYLFQLPPPISGIDVVIHLSVPDKVAIKRACGRRRHKNGEEYHEVNRPPPEGSYTGVPPSYDEFNVKHRYAMRLAGFLVITSCFSILTIIAHVMFSVI